MFYHPGFFRTSRVEKFGKESGTRFVIGEHTLSFDEWQNTLAREPLIPHPKFSKQRERDLPQAGPHYIDVFVNPFIKRVIRFLFHSAKEKLERKERSWHLIGLNFVISADFKIFFIAANDQPDFPRGDQFTDKHNMLEQLESLVLELNDSPEAFMRMRRGDMYGGFHLAWSEIEERQRHLHYRPCDEWAKNLHASPGKLCTVCVCVCVCVCV